MDILIQIKVIMGQFKLKDTAKKINQIIIDKKTPIIVWWDRSLFRVY